MIRRRTLETQPSTSTRSHQSKATARSLTRRDTVAEIIVKEGFSLASTSQGGTIAVPELAILANRKGFAFLSRVFADVAKRGLGRVQAGDPDPENHEHLGWAKPFDTRRSDRIDIRLGVFTKANRPHVLARYGITKASSQRGDLRHRYRRLIAESSVAVKRDSRSKLHSRAKRRGGD